MKNWTSIVILTYILKPKYNVEKVVKFDLIKACHWCSYRCFDVIFAYRYGQASSTGQSLLPLGSTAKLSSLKPPQYCPELEIPNIMSKIQQLGISVVNSKPEIDHHTGNDFTTHKPLPNEVPQFIIYPDSTEQVSQALKILNEYKVPVVPFSGGTSLEGHFHSTRRGVVIDTSKLNKILAINDNDLDVVVQAGVNWQDLNQVLEPYGLMFGTDCGHNGLISGMIGTNASGINASRYGAMSANVISVTAVLPDGTIIKQEIDQENLVLGII